MAGWGHRVNGSALCVWQFCAGGGARADVEVYVPPSPAPRKRGCDLSRRERWNLSQEFAGWEEEGNFIGGGFWGVGAVGGVLFDVDAEFFADCAGVGFFGIGRAHQLAPFCNCAFALQYRDDDRA